MYCTHFSKFIRSNSPTWVSFTFMTADKTKMNANFCKILLRIFLKVAVIDHLYLELLNQTSFSLVYVESYCTYSKTQYDIV